MDKNMIRFEIKNVRPVEVSDFALSMEAFADEFRRHVAAEDPDVADEVKLYIKAVQSGSIIADLIQMAPDAMPFLGDANTMVKFSDNLGKVIKWLKTGGQSNVDQTVSNKTLENVSQVIEPTAKDPGAEMNLTNVNIGGDLVVNINSTEANAVQNTINRIIKERKDKSSGYVDEAILYWYQTRNDLKSDYGDRAIIESISEKDVKTRFGNDDLKKRMIRGDQNPYRCAYLVDVHVETAKGKPVLYTVTNFHDNLGEI